MARSMSIYFGAFIVIAISTAAGQVFGGPQGLLTPQSEDVDRVTTNPASIEVASAASPSICLGKTIGIYADPASTSCFYFCYGSVFPGADPSSDLGYRSCCCVGSTYTMPSLRYPVGACVNASPTPPSPRPPPPLPPSSQTSPPPRRQPPPPPSPPPPRPPPPSPPPPRPRPPPPAPQPPPPTVRPPPPSPQPPPPSFRPPPPLILPNCSTDSFVPDADTCGSSFDVIQVFDNGDGTCSASGPQGDTNCSVPIYGNSNCRSLGGELQIVFRRVSTAPYVQPTIQQYLNTLGIGAVVYVKTLRIILNEKLNSVPPISPNFLSSLVWVESLQVTSDFSTWGNWSTAIKALPGFAANLRRADNLEVSYSGLQNMASFSSLQCLRNLAAQYNSALTVLDGLQNATAPSTGPGTGQGSGLYLYANPLPTGSSLAALRTYAGCPSGSISPWGTAILVYNTAGTCYAQNFNQLCAFMNTGVCSLPVG
eukprot:jgi/Botrbrau1/12713/Bobra.67_1s0076.1